MSARLVVSAPLATAPRISAVPEAKSVPRTPALVPATTLALDAVAPSKSRSRWLSPSTASLTTMPEPTPSRNSLPSLPRLLTTPFATDRPRAVVASLV